MADIIGLDGKRAASDKKPEPRHFEIVFLPLEGNLPNSVKGFGFLIVSPAFIGIVDVDDRVQIMVPADNILYVRDSAEG